MGQAGPDIAQLVPVLESLGAWAGARHQPTGGLRQVLIFSHSSGGQGTEMEWAVALRPAGP